MRVYEVVFLVGCAVIVLVLYVVLFLNAHRAQQKAECLRRILERPEMQALLQLEAERAVYMDAQFPRLLWRGDESVFQRAGTLDEKDRDGGEHV